MTVSQMHIELRLSLSQVGANRNLKYLPEELDLVLNKMQGRFIQSCLKPRNDGSGGFEIDQYSTDRVRNLLTTIDMVPYVKKDHYECYLPYDYAYLISDSSTTKDLCGTAKKSLDRKLYIYGIRQERSKKTAGPYYTQNDITLKGTTVTIPEDLGFGNDYVGYNNVKDIEFLVPYIGLQGKFWWERLWDYYYPGYYLMVSNTELTDESTCTVDGDVSVTLVNETRAEIIDVGGDRVVDNRLTASNQVGKLNMTEFYKTAAYSPVSELSGNILKVYNDSSFIVSNVGLTYIRKCRPISLSLNSHSELPDEFHQTICDLSTEYLKGRLENTTGQQLAERDIDKRIIL